MATFNRHTYIDRQMPEDYVVERNGRKYVYRSTSRYVPGEKYPVTVNEYVGRLDEYTGRIIPKKSRSRPDKPSKETGSRRFGGSYALLGMAEACGLRDDLRAAYGNDGDAILAAAVAQALAGGPLCSVEDAADGCLVREMLGVRWSLPASGISRLTRRLGSDTKAMDGLFRMRILRCRGILAFDRTSLSARDRDYSWAGRRGGPEGRMPALNVGLLTGLDGFPAMFDVYGDAAVGLEDLLGTVKRSLSLGAQTCALALGEDLVSADGIKGLIESGVPFAVRADRSTASSKELMSRLVKMRGRPNTARFHAGRPYPVLQTEVAVVPVSDPGNGPRWEVVTDSDPRFADASAEMRLTAHVCYDGVEASEEKRSLEDALDGITEELRSMDPWTAVREQRKIAGEYSRFLECWVEGDRLIVSRKHNAVSFLLNRAGMTVMLSKGFVSWDDVMSAYDCRTVAERTFDSYANELDGGLLHPGDMTYARGRVLLKFLALTMCTEMSRRLNRARADIPVAGALRALDNICAVGSWTDWTVTDLTEPRIGLLEALGLPKPPLRIGVPGPSEPSASRRGRPRACSRRRGR